MKATSVSEVVAKLCRRSRRWGLILTYSQAISGAMLKDGKTLDAQGQPIIDPLVYLDQLLAQMRDGKVGRLVDFDDLRYALWTQQVVIYLFRSAQSARKVLGSVPTGSLVQVQLVDSRGHSSK